MDEKLSGWDDLTTIAKDLADAAQAFDLARCGGVESPTTTTPEIRLARQRVSTVLERFRGLATEPCDFIQRLARHVQLLACLQWLGEFQVLACIPLGGSVAAREVADLADVPEILLVRIVRLMATAGFLGEPQPGHIAHTALSASFVTDLGYLDAAMMLAKTAAPTALQMTAATQIYMDGHPHRPATSAYSLAFNTAQTFQSACEEQPRLNSQWLAYLRCTESEGDGITGLLSGTGWFNLALGSARVVDVGAPSTARAKVLARLNPALHFTVQLTRAEPTNGSALSVHDLEADSDNLNHRIAVQIRPPTPAQTIKDATLFILNLPTCLESVASRDLLRRRIVADLRTHAEILRANTSAALILLPDLLLYDDGRIEHAEAKATSYFRDLSIWQMTNGWGMGLSELMELLSEVQDGMGRLAVTDELRMPNGAIGALYVKYQSKWGY